MNLSAIVVLTRPERVERLARRVAELPGFEVHHEDPATGRFIVIQEATDIEAEVEGLRRLQRLPGVVAAELVEHHFPDEATAREVSPAAVPSLLSH